MEQDGKKKRRKKKKTSKGTIVTTFPSFFHLPVILIRCAHLATFELEVKKGRADAGYKHFQRWGGVRPEEWS